MPDARVKSVLESIAANVRRARLRRGLTQEEAAELADLDLRFFQRVEAAKTNMTIGGLVRLSDGLDVPLASLLRPADMPARPRGRPKQRRRSTQ